MLSASLESGYTGSFFRYPGNEVFCKFKSNLARLRGSDGKFISRLGYLELLSMFFSSFRFKWLLCQLSLSRLVSPSPNYALSAPSGAPPTSGPLAAPLGHSGKFHYDPSILSIPATKAGKPGYGSVPSRRTPMSTKARQLVRWGAAAIEEKFGSNRCSFVTGTLPGSTPLAHACFAAYSSWFLDRLKQWLYQNFSIDGVCYMVGVWELQPKRGALHLHFLIGLLSEEDKQRLYDSFPPFWIHLLETISDATGIDLFERASGGTWRGRLHESVKEGLEPMMHVTCRVEHVHTSVRAYLSKYLSKGSELPDSYMPRQWHTITRSVHQLIKAGTKSYSLGRIDSENYDVIVGLVVEEFDREAEWSNSGHVETPSGFAYGPDMVIGRFSENPAKLLKRLQVMTRKVCKEFNKRIRQHSKSIHSSILKRAANIIQSKQEEEYLNEAKKFFRRPNWSVTSEVVQVDDSPVLIDIPQYVQLELA